MKRRCLVCGEDKELELLVVAPKCKHGRRALCKKCKSISAMDHARRHPVETKARIDKWKKDNPERMRELNRNGVRKYRTKYPERGAKYRADNAERLQVAATKRARERRRTIPSIKIRQNISRRIRNMLKTGSKWAHSVYYLGCTIEELKQQLESQFKDGMSWDNYGFRGWHIDHIIPCSAFDLNNPEAQIECFHHNNLQPLWWRDNIVKGGINRYHVCNRI